MRISAYTRLNRKQKTTTIGLAAAAGITALTAGIAPGSDGGDAGRSPAKPVAGHSANADAAGKKQTAAAKGEHAKDTKSVQLAGASAGHQTKAYQGKDAKAEQKNEAEADVKAEQEKKAEDVRADRGSSRAADRATKADNLDGWIKQARSIMKEEGIPGSYHGIKKNIIRESGGDPNAVNDWDINAKKGTPSKGLLQTIQPTFDAYHVEGTKHDVTDPVANIVAACNYAADKYGSMDNVNSAY